MGSGIVVLPSLQELEEFLSTPFLKQTHKRTFHSLHFRTGNLGYLAIAIDETTCNLFEFEITSDIGVDQYLGQFPRCNNKLWDEINCVVAIATYICWWSLVWTELAV